MWSGRDVFGLSWVRSQGRSFMFSWVGFNLRNLCLSSPFNLSEKVDQIGGEIRNFRDSDGTIYERFSHPSSLKPTSAASVCPEKLHLCLDP